MTSLRPAVFLDRDGVLNVLLRGDYVKSPADLALLPGVGEAVRALNEAGFPVFVISNQQGVAKGLMTARDLERVDRALQDEIAVSGAHITQSCYCTHGAADDCACRKPMPGLILQAAAEHPIDLAASFFVGDTATDAQAARAAGVGTFVLVLTGHSTQASVAEIQPDFVRANLLEAAEIIRSSRDLPIGSENGKSSCEKFIS